MDASQRATKDESSGLVRLVLVRRQGRSGITWPPNGDPLLHVYTYSVLWVPLEKTMSTRGSDRDFVVTLYAESSSLTVPVMELPEHTILMNPYGDGESFGT